MALRGWVYIVTNRAIPGLVKVGYSMKDPQIRAAEFDNAGLPYPYTVVYEALVESPRDIEQKTHTALKPYLENREWFRCEPHVAVAALRAAAGPRLHEMAGEGARPPQPDRGPPRIRLRDPSRFARAREALRLEWERRGVWPKRDKEGRE